MIHKFGKRQKRKDPQRSTAAKYNNNNSLVIVNKGKYYIAQ